MAGTIKDIVTRYAHQQGYHVDRRFGWDCHGLPIEFEIDKLFGIKTPDDIQTKMGGIENYNNECRKIVMRYAEDWRQIIGRMGRWIDFDNDYKTLYPSFMESIWWVFKQLFAKGLVYRGVKVMPYSTACTTPLSNFESGQNYKEVVDPSVIVTFPLLDDSNVSILAWTTTPWTLPSNLALCVNPALEYCQVVDSKTQKSYILMECRLEFCFGKGFADQVKVVKKFLGKELEGKKYMPMFDYFKSNTRAFRILCDGYVSNENGTGIVHQAPFFGEDDHRVCLKNDVISKEDNFCPIDDCGRFVEPVTEFLGIYVKDADKSIIKNLKERDRLFSAGQMKHSYPFCWRSDTPLIYKAVPSWFVRVEQFQQKLTTCSSQTYWVPEFVKEKRFGNWLREARDWAVSRNRYWGTPMPIWTSEDFQEIVVIGSIEELSQLSGIEVAKITDLHRENIDKITIPSQRAGQPPLKRISEVFDCWFESGSMPFAQQHYPFENAAEFPNLFPADFIAEGIDQTRGWFYTLLVVSTLLFNKPPFKNLIANGLVLASDGQKMSKRKKNYPDPMVVVRSYGADALRLYLINSPVVRAENLKFKEEGVRDVVKDVFLPWYNAFRFFYQNVDRLRDVDKVEFKVDVNFTPTNVMDTWIVSFKESLLAFIAKEMKAYRLYTVVPRLTKFIDQLTNWYIRLNRRRIKGEFGVEDCSNALNTLFDILLAMTKMMAPFTPFLTEFMYQRLHKFVSTDTGKMQSVHYEMMPVFKADFIDEHIETQVANMQRVIELGRILRDRKTIPIKYPLSELVILMTSCDDEQRLREEFANVETFIKNELNVRDILYTNDKSKFGVKMACEPDHKVLGTKFKANYKKITDMIKALTDSEIEQVQLAGELKLNLPNGEVITIAIDELRFSIKMEANKTDRDLVGESDRDLLVLLNVRQDAALMEEGHAREVINRVQKLKKKLNLVQSDLVFVTYKLVQGNGAVLEKYKQFIEAVIKSDFSEEASVQGKSLGLMAEEDVHIANVDLKFKLAIHREVQQINLPFINVRLLHPHNIIDASVICPPDLTFQQFLTELRNLFRIHARKHVVVLDKARNIVRGDDFKKHKFVYVYLEENEKMMQESGAELMAKWATGVQEAEPYCRFVNFTANGRPGTMFVENPKGTKTIGTDSDIERVLGATFACKTVENIQFSV